LPAFLVTYSRLDGILESLITTWIDKTQLMKFTSPDLNSRSLFDSHARISDWPFHQKVNTDIKRTKREKHEQTCLMKFAFLQEKRYKAIHGELPVVLGEAVISLTTVKVRFRRFKQGHFSLDDESRPDDLSVTFGTLYLGFSEKSCFLLDVSTGRNLRQAGIFMGLWSELRS
jgi:hypothetical protein